MLRNPLTYLILVSMVLILAVPSTSSMWTAQGLPLRIHIRANGTGANRNGDPLSSRAPLIYIRANGTVEPANVSIQRTGNTYTFTNDVNALSIIIERSGITVNGNWHRLNGTGFLDGRDGFNLTGLTGVTVERVKISNFYSGIGMYLSTRITLVQNELTNNSYGIYANWSNDSIISRNKVMHNNGGGLYMPSEFNVTVEDNLVSWNIDYAMRVEYTRNCTFLRNIVANNYGPGIHMFLSYNNTVFHNTFINNTPNAISQGSVNIWDDGYPSGGNYWFDYQTKYHDTVEIDSSGIWGTPYVIDGNNTDRYPYVRPLPIGLLGDVNYDGVVNILDITIIASAYNHTEGEPQWIPQADLVPPYGTINMLDLVTCAAHYGETFPENDT